MYVDFIHIMRRLFVTLINLFPYVHINNCTRKQRNKRMKQRHLTGWPFKIRMKLQPSMSHVDELALQFKLKYIYTKQHVGKFHETPSK